MNECPWPADTKRVHASKVWHYDEEKVSEHGKDEGKKESDFDFW